jgi:hypothetical protein
MISDSKNVRLIALSVSKQKSTNESKAPQVAGQEPFVAGADTMIDRVVADIPDAERGFTMIFSAMPFPGYQYQLDWRREEGGGNWNYSAALGTEGRLCPALLRYFSEAPKQIYLQTKARG